LQQVDGPPVDASKAAFERAGVGPKDMDVMQLQDTEGGAEIMHMSENGFCEDGEQEALIQQGATHIGGSMPVNTDGGCLANGEPIGASGLRQVYENVLQLRGQAGDHQVPHDPKLAYTHVYGAPGISAITILQR
jgi:acetyl-CoA acetyltransferase